MAPKKLPRLWRETKTCTRCGTPRFYWMFNKQANRTDGRMGICNVCTPLMTRDWRTALRLDALSRYGSVCACCGEARFQFLVIDHIAGGGTRHRAELKAAKISMVQWLRKQGWPAGYRVLCSNCNSAIGHYGECPHATDSARIRPA